MAFASFKFCPEYDSLYGLPPLRSRALIVQVNTRPAGQGRYS